MWKIFQRPGNVPALWNGCGVTSAFSSLGSKMLGGLVFLALLLRREAFVGFPSNAQENVMLMFHPQQERFVPGLGMQKSPEVICQIESLLWRALLSFHDGERESALALLHQALYVAEPARMAHLFVQGLPLLEGLFQELHCASRFTLQRCSPRFLQDVIAVLTRHSSVQHSEATKLSKREVEVLKEVSRGATNREIAKVLCISPETVKKHLKNVSVKLGTKNRLQAVTKARALGELL